MRGVRVIAFLLVAVFAVEYAQPARADEMSPSTRTGVIIFVVLATGCVAASAGLAGDLASRLGPGSDPSAALDARSYHDRLAASASLGGVAAGLFAGAILWGTLAPRDVAPSFTKLDTRFAMIRPFLARDSAGILLKGEF